MLLTLLLTVSLAAFASSTSTSNNASIDGCPGYAATNIRETANALTADLTLAGSACNVYGADISDLKLLVEYQSGK